MDPGEVREGRKTLRWVLMNGRRRVLLRSVLKDTLVT